MGRRARRATPRRAGLLETHELVERLESRFLFNSTIYVDDSATAGAKDGTSWQNAYTDLQQALSAAQAGDEIHLGAGTYKPTYTFDQQQLYRFASFQLKNGVSVMGGYAGYGAADPDSRDWAANQTILSGNVGAVSIATDNSFHVVVGSGTDSSAVLEGFTITDGVANLTVSGFNCGAGMYNAYGSPTVRDCMFSANAVGGTDLDDISAGSGGAIYNDHSSPTISNCTFTGNIATGGSKVVYDRQTDRDEIIDVEARGGAIYNLQSNPVFTACSFNANRAGIGGNGFYLSNAAPASGGAMYDDGDCSPVLNQCTFSNNLAITFADTYTLDGLPQTRGYDAIGGAIACGGSSGSGIAQVAANTCVFKNNVAKALAHFDGYETIGGDAHGGAIFAPGTNLTLNACSFTQNQALAPAGDTGSGAVYCDNGALAVDQSTFSLNSANGFGASAGAMLYSDCSGTISDCTFDQDSCRGSYSGGGGGANVDVGSDVSLSDCTFSNDLSSSSSASPFGADGGAVVNSRSRSTFVRCTFVTNVAHIDGGTSGAGGGAVYNYLGSPTFTNCTFTRNATQAAIAAGASRGGAMVNEGASVTVVGCVFRGNLVTQYGLGGGVANIANATASFVNCIFVDNYGGAQGGGAYNADSTVRFVNCTFTANFTYIPTLADAGGAISDAGTTGDTLFNCILWGDISSVQTEIYSQTFNAPAIGFTDVQDSIEPGPGNIDADPLFFRAAGVGPDKIRCSADDDYGNLRLRSTSPAIDVGINSALPADVTTDIAGNPRIVDFPNVPPDGTAVVDLGAYEGGSAQRLVVPGAGSASNFYVNINKLAGQINIWPTTDPNGPATWSLNAASVESIDLDCDLIGTIVINAAGGVLPDGLIEITGTNNGGSTLLITPEAPAAGAAEDELDIEPGGQIALDSMTIACDAGFASTQFMSPPGTTLTLLTLNVSAPIALPAGKHLTLDVAQLNISDDAALNLNDSDLIIDNADAPTPVGSWTGSAYTGVRGLIASGYNGGMWNGAGVITSSAAGIYTTLAAAQASEVLGPAGGVFDGHTVGPTAVLVKFTYGGDATLDGKLNIDDYIRIDSGIASGLNGWHNGDFNDDGVVNIDDYLIIDSNIATQGPPL